MLRNHIRPHFGMHVKVQDVTFADIDRLHSRITNSGHLYRANAVMRVLSKMFSLAIRWDMRDSNPCKGIEKNIEYSRRRYLSGDELARLTKALAEHNDKQAADIIRVLLLTGCRRGEALSMRWADIDLAKGVWSKPASSTKQKEPHEAPLSAPVRQLLSEIQASRTAGIECSASSCSRPSARAATGSRSSAIGSASARQPGQWAEGPRPAPFFASPAGERWCQPAADRCVAWTLQSGHDPSL